MTEKRTRRGLKVVDQNFLTKKFDTIQNFLDSNLETVDSLTTPIISSPLAFAKVNANLDIITDQGSGRLSSGLRSLDVLARGLNGTDLDKLYLFDYPPIVTSPARFLNNSDLENQIIIIQTLGVFELLPLAVKVNPELNESIYSLANNIVKSIKNKTFTIQLYKSRVFTLCKKIAIAASIYKGTI